MTVAKDGQHQQVIHLYGRFNKQTRAITDPDEAEKFKLQIWG